MKKLRPNSGFTLIELIVVIMMVAILAAIAIPIYRGRIDEARWSEGKAIGGTIASALRAYAAEKGDGGTYGTNLPSEKELGFGSGELKGAYFDGSNFKWTSSYNSSSKQVTYTIEISKGPAISSPSKYALNDKGLWEETP